MTGTGVLSRAPGVVHHHTDTELWASSGPVLYHGSPDGSGWRRVTRVPLGTLGAAAASTRLSRRLLRAGVHHLVPVEDRWLVAVANRRIFRYDRMADQWAGNAAPVIGSRPLALCLARDGTLYFGEYRNNPERSPVRVFGSRDAGATWEPVWTFNRVRHVHGVFQDPFDGAVWVTTGDEDDECAIWVSHDRFRSLSPVVRGHQQARAVALVFTATHVYFGSDTPREQNYLYRLGRADLRPERLQPVGGSVFFGRRVGPHICFGTVCEPSAVNPPRPVELWHSADGVRWRCILTCPKDRWPMRLFQYGQIRFPGGDANGPWLWCTPFAAEGDQQSVLIDLSGASGDDRR